jgi:hypothetical protein
MSHPLDGPRLRLKVAHGCIDALNAAFKALDEVSVEHLDTQFTGKPGEYVILVTKNPPLDPAWSIRIGDIAHNLKACLDNLAWQVALLNTPTPYERTQFPVCERRFRRKGTTAANFFYRGAGQVHHQIQSVARKHRAFFDRVQPYQRGQREHWRDPLWLLNKMNNTDKHRLLLVTALAPTKVLLQSHDGRSILWVRAQTGNVFKKDAELCRFRLSGPDTSVNVQAQFTLHVAFGQSCEWVSGHLVIDLLRHTWARVRDILAEFEPLFS